MASITIPWNDGPGNIVLTYAKGEGNQQVVVTSDTDNLGQDRQQEVSFVIQNGEIYHTIGTSSGHTLRTANGKYLRSLDNAMKVTVLVIQPTGMRVLVTASNHRLRTSIGHIIRCHPTVNP